MSLMPSLRCMAAGNPGGVSIIFSGDKRVIRCEGAWALKASARLDKGVTSRRGMLRSIKPVKSAEELVLGFSGAHRGQPGRFDGFWRGSKQAARFPLLKTGQLCGLVIGREVVGALEEGFQDGRHARRQAES